MANNTDDRRWLLMLPTDAIGKDLASEAEGTYFHMWRTRMEPYTSLQDGDTIYLVDRDERRVIWELRARHLLRTPYHSMDEAFTALRTSFGWFPEDLSDYVLDRPTDGFLLGWAIEVVAPVDLPLPAEIDFGALGARHGYLPWSRLPEGAQDALGLPAPGRPALAEPATWMTGDSMLGRPVPAPGRYIPAAMRRAVWERDGGRCTQCGDANPPLHFDHIWPIVKGGGNELANIQLLCRTHNLEKAAKIVTGARRPASLDPVSTLAAELGVADPRSDLAAFVQVAIDANRGGDAGEALLRELDLTSEPVSLRPAIETLGDDSPQAALLRARLAELIATEDSVTARELAADLLDHPDIDVRGTAALAMAEASPDLDPEERRALYNAATASGDRWVAAFAHLYLAEIENDPLERVGHLEQAAASPDPTPRSRAAFVLGSLATDEDEASAWFRRALITQEPELFAECAAQLALLTGSCDYAKWALQAEAQDVRELAHLVLGLNECDDNPRSHLEEASKSTDAGVRTEALAALMKY